MYGIYIIIAVIYLFIRGYCANKLYKLKKIMKLDKENLKKATIRFNESEKNRKKFHKNSNENVKWIRIEKGIQCIENYLKEFEDLYSDYNFNYDKKLSLESKFDMSLKNYDNFKFFSLFMI